ncbi:hypothetical protein CLOM_g11661 [Closterium sp. NIES-68]|nr:hypothetical protein CLOM_g11661 [Closterium sp. NIES-68]
MGTRASLTLLTIALFLTACVADLCPKFECGEGTFKRGKFIDATSADPTEGSTRFLVEAFFTATQMYNYLEFNVTGDETLAHPEVECHRYCSAYNARLTRTNTLTVSALEAKYWMFEQTCEEGNGGICTCFNADACADEWSFSPAWMEPAEGQGTDRFEPASNWTVGSLCTANEKGDPHFTGADGSHFDFSGRPNRNYALISDAHIQINAFFGGRYGVWANHAKALTWIRSLAILTGHHLLVLDARRGASAEYGDGYLVRILVDGSAMELDTPGTSLQLWPGAELAWVAAGKRDGGDLIDVYELKVANVVTLRVTLRPEIAAMRTATDGTVHMSIGVERASLSPAVHGILGQTFRPDFIGRLAQQQLVHSDLLHEDVVPGDDAQGFIDGVVKDYQVSALTRADCRFCRFARAALVDEEMARALELTGGYFRGSVGVVGGGGYRVGGGGAKRSPRKALLLNE